MRVAGNGLKTSFWEDRWAGESTLRARFPRLYELSLDKESSVHEAGVWIDREWWWGEGWKRCQNDEDRWKWKLEQAGNYSVKSAYSLLMERKAEPHEGKSIISSLIWENWAVPKVQAIAWKIASRRVATKAELSRRGVLGPNSSLVCPSLW
ncbi:hypothetical protein OROMI_016283 [Orobanche minor]